MPEMDQKDKRQFKRAVATLNKILENAQEMYPEAMYHIEGFDLQLLSEPYNPQAKKQSKNILARSPLEGLDG